MQMVTVTAYSNDFENGLGGSTGLKIDGKHNKIDRTPWPTNPLQPQKGNKALWISLVQSRNVFTSPQFPVTPNTSYTFKYYASRRNRANPVPRLQVKINNQIVVGEHRVPEPKWEEHTGQWNSGSATTASILVEALELGSAGNDFGIDNITLTTQVEKAPAEKPSPAKSDPSENDTDKGLNINIKGLAAYYPFTGNADDASGNNNNATAHGATLTKDRFNNANCAYYFDGVDDYIETPIDAQPKAMQSTTWSVWVRPTRIRHKGWQGILSTDDGSWDRSLHIPDGGTTFTVFNRRGGGHWAPVSVDLNQWQHIVVIYSPEKIVLYKNGVRHESAAAAGQQPTKYTLHIGHSPQRNGCQPYQGDIDDVCIFDRALSDAEVQELYQLQSKKPEVKKELVVKATDTWLDTGFDAVDGKQLVITATGKWKVDSKGETIEVTGDGYGISLSGTPLEDSFAALIGRVGENGKPFLVGTNFSNAALGSGRLFLQMNDVTGAHGDNVGELQVTVELK